MKFFSRLLRPVQWYNLRTTQPISNVFGLDRGLPIDRYYIEKFINENSDLIKGCVLEIGDDTYTKKYGTTVTKSEVLHFTKENPKATLVGDLTNVETLPQSVADCFICTQTFNFIYDFKKAIEGAHFLLKENGVLIATLAGVCQISKFDMDRWGDFWRFTTLSASKVFGEVFGEQNISVRSYGNVLSAISLLHGISANELEADELDYNDLNYQIVITVIAKKC